MIDTAGPVTTRAILWTAATVALVLAATAALADRRRGKRADLDRVGWVPWGAMQTIALFAAIICAALALNAGEG